METKPATTPGNLAQVCNDFQKRYLKCCLSDLRNSYDWFIRDCLNSPSGGLRHKIPVRGRSLFGLSERT